MTVRQISTNASAVAQALNDLEGYPRDPTHRGSACPPAPFGRTVGHQVYVDGETDEESTFARADVLERHHGRMANGVTIRRDMGDPFDRARRPEGGGGRAGEQGQ